MTKKKFNITILVWQNCTEQSLIFYETLKNLKF